MNPPALLLIVAALAANQDVNLSVLKGDVHRGRLQQISDSSVTLAGDEGEKRVPISDVLKIVFAEAETAQPDVGRTPLAALVDGSRFRFNGMSADVREMTFETPGFGKIALPLTAVASVRFAASDANVQNRWEELCSRESAQDLLVIRKGNVLDHIAGVVGRIDDQRIHFVLDGDEIPLPREKVFGVVYARSRPEALSPLCALNLRGGDVIHLARVGLQDEMLTTEWIAGPHVDVPLAEVQSIDFSFGKVRYLSDMEPRQIKYTPYIDITWEYRRDRTWDGNPIRLGNREFARGLWIHSRTYLKYRIGRSYRRFQATMGIDQAVSGMGDVHVVISGDGKALLETDVRGVDPPRPIDLDVSGVRDLEILVDFGEDRLDIADHLDLADARVVK